MRLTVATYNIHKGVANQLFGVRRAATIHGLRTRLHELCADLVFLQEVQGENERHARRFEQWPAERQDQFLARPLLATRPFQSAYGRNASYLHGHHGNALLSRFPIMREDNRDVSDHALEKRGVLHCVIDVEGVAVHCFVVHFGLFARSRERQADVLIDWIGKTVAPDEPLIVAGDFNDWRDHLSERLYRRLCVTEVFDVARPPLVRKAAHFVRARLAPGETAAAEPLPGTGADRRAMLPGVPRMAQPTAIRPARTFPSLLPCLRMDRIYQRGFRVVDAQVLRGPAWARLSDHAPLVATLDLLPHAARSGRLAQAAAPADSTKARAAAGALSTGGAPGASDAPGTHAPGSPGAHPAAAEPAAAGGRSWATVLVASQTVVVRRVPSGWAGLVGRLAAQVRWWI